MKVFCKYLLLSMFLSLHYINCEDRVRSTFEIKDGKIRVHLFHRQLCNEGLGVCTKFSYCSNATDFNDGSSHIHVRFSIDETEACHYLEMCCDPENVIHSVQGPVDFNDVSNIITEDRANNGEANLNVNDGCSGSVPEQNSPLSTGNQFSEQVQGQGFTIVSPTNEQIISEIDYPKFSNNASILNNQKCSFVSFFNFTFRFASRKIISAFHFSTAKQLQQLTVQEF